VRVVIGPVAIGLGALVAIGIVASGGGLAPTVPAPTAVPSGSVPPGWPVETAAGPIPWSEVSRGRAGAWQYADRLRELVTRTIVPFARVYGVRPRITSGYRDPASNEAADGSTGSYHLTGQAIDVAPPPGWTAARFALWFADHATGWDQIIAYATDRGGHIHIGYRLDTRRGLPRGMLLVAWSNDGGAERVATREDFARLNANPNAPRAT
jgi:hypothetical protein